MDTPGLESAPDRANATSQSSQEPMQHLVVFSTNGRRYALPLLAVERVLSMVEVSALPKAPAVVLGVINIHGKIIPVIDFRRRFSLPPRSWGLTSYLLVARTSRRTLALAVDEVIGVNEITKETVTPPEAVVPGTSLVAGIVALSDGILLIYDLDAFLSLDEEDKLIEALEGSRA